MIITESESPALRAVGCLKIEFSDLASPRPKKRRRSNGAIAEVKQLGKQPRASKAVDWADLFKQEEGKVKGFFCTKKGRLVYNAIADAYTGQAGCVFFVNKIKPMGEPLKKLFLNHLEDSEKRFNWIVLAIAIANVVRGLNIYNVDPSLPNDVKKAIEEFFMISYHLLNASLQGVESDANQ